MLHTEAGRLSLYQAPPTLTPRAAHSNTLTPLPSPSHQVPLTLTLADFLHHHSPSYQPTLSTKSATHPHTGHFPQLVVQLCKFVEHLHLPHKTCVQVASMQEPMIEGQRNVVARGVLQQSARDPMPPSAPQTVTGCWQGAQLVGPGWRGRGGWCTGCTSFLSTQAASSSAKQPCTKLHVRARYGP